MFISPGSQALPDHLKLIMRPMLLGMPTHTIGSSFAQEAKRTDRGLQEIPSSSSKGVVGKNSGIKLLAVASFAPDIRPIISPV